jgi:hypothetical protein
VKIPFFWPPTPLATASIAGLSSEKFGPSSYLRRCFWLTQRGTNLKLRRLEKPKIIDNILSARYGLGMAEE